MFKSCSIANSQRMLTEINESAAIAKISIGVKVILSNIKAFRIISGEMKISLLVVCIFRDYFLLSCKRKMFFQIFASKLFRSVVLKNSS